MDKKKMIVRLAAVVSTLGETTQPGEASPATPIYLALGADMAQYNLIVSMGESVGWLTATSETITLTPAGREKAKEFQALGV